MPALLKPSECSVLVLNGNDDAADQTVADNIASHRQRILQAASPCGIPAFFAARARDHATQAALGATARSFNPLVYSCCTTGVLWAETSLAHALAATDRSSLLLCGYWLDECITFTALNALGEGYDVYVLTDASPPLDLAERDTTILRLLQAGVVPTTTKQAIREWAADTADASQRDQLLALT